MDEIKFGTVTIAAPGDFFSNYRMRAESVTQVHRPMRGSRGAVYDRGGEIVRIACTVGRRHETHADARAHLHEQRRAIRAAKDAGVDEVEMTVTGGGATSQTLENATASIDDAWTQGVNSYIAWRIEGAEPAPV